MADDRVLPVEEVDRPVRARSSMSDGRKFGSVEETIGSTSVPAKLEPLSSILYWRMPWKPITLATSRLPWIVLGEVPAGEDLDAGAGPGALLVDLRRARRACSG